MIPMIMQQEQLNQSILFVDDDEMVLRGVKRLFHQNRVPWRSSFATNVDEALSILELQDIDAVISDIKMPGRDGFDLLSSLRANNKLQDLPVVILTGLDRHGLKSKALDLGATDLLCKPVDPEELFARIRSMLQLKRCQDEIKTHNNRLEELVQKRTKLLEATRLDMIWRLGKIAEFRSDETGNHVIRVGFFARIIAEKLGMDHDFIETLFLTSPLHDIGKIGIPDAILQKSGKFDENEWEIMKTHCVFGEKMLSTTLLPQDFGYDIINDMLLQILSTENNPFLKMAEEIAIGHHEKWGGGGYPHGIRGEEIPLAARIVAVCDVYDALRNRRCYKPAWSHEATMEVMRDDSKDHFDPDVFNAFLESQKEIYTIHEQYAGKNLTVCGELHRTNASIIPH